MPREVPAKSGGRSSPWLSSRPVRHLLAALCLTACVGFLSGTLIERFTAKTARRVEPAALPTQPSPLTGSGNLVGKNPFTASDAQGMEAGDYEAALGRYRADLAVAETEIQQLAIADKLHEIGLSAHMRDKGQGRVAIAAYEEAITVYRRLKRLDRLESVLPDLADDVLLRGDRKRALDSWTETMTLPGVSQNADILVRAGDFRRAIGDYSQAENLLNRALSLSREAQNDRLSAHALRYLGAVQSDFGQYTKAVVSLSESARLLAKIGEMETRAAVLGTWGDALLRNGDTAGATALYQEGLGVWESRQHQYWTAVFKSRLGLAAWYMGDDKMAATQAKESLNLLDASNGPVGRIIPLRILGNIARRAGDLKRAITLHKEALALRRKSGNPRTIAEGLEDLARDQTDPKIIADLRAQADRLRKEAGTPIPPIDRNGLVSR